MIRAATKDQLGTELSKQLLLFPRATTLLTVMLLIFAIIKMSTTGTRLNRCSTSTPLQIELGFGLVVNVRQRRFDSHPPGRRAALGEVVECRARHKVSGAFPQRRAEHSRGVPVGHGRTNFDPPIPRVITANARARPRTAPLANLLLRLHGNGRPL